MTRLERQVRGDRREHAFETSDCGTGPSGDAEEREIKAEDVGDDQPGEAGERGSADTRFCVCYLMAATATARVNPYAGLTNSGPRKRKAQQGNNASPHDHPHAPAPRKTKAKKTTTSGYEKCLRERTHWLTYGDRKLVDTRSLQRYTRGDVVDLKYVLVLISSIENAIAAGNDITKLLNKLRERLHQVEFNGNLCYQLVQDSELLEDQGLPKIFGTAVQFPHNLADDSLVLYQRWSRGLFDAHLLHGIELKSRVQLDDNSFRSRNLEKDYAFKVSAHYIGAGELINGQWWPLQICLIRDGAHGEIEAGICGELGKGVFSIVVGSGGYDNIDNGDVIQYCGTSGSNGKETGNTRLMMESLNRGNAVRVIRSGTANNNKKTVYQPASGLRYDGLYEVVEDELLHAATAMHRFKLERLSGQHPIRYKGVEARPTPEERRSYDSIREKLGLKG